MMSAEPLSKAEISPAAIHIARVAARLFALQGYDATSVREIVEGAGVAKPTLYYYFRSKEGLAKALVLCPCRIWWNSLPRSSTASGIPIRCLELILEAHFQFCREDPDRSRFLYALIFGPPGSEPAHDMECCKEDLGKWVEAAIRRLADAGIIARERVDACATMFRGLIVITTIDFLYGDKPLGQDLPRSLVNNLLEGFDLRRTHEGTE